MKNLVVYFSLEGNTKFVADEIANEADCDVLELKSKKQYSTGRIGKYFWGGRSVMMKEKPELINEIPDLESYDNIIIGTPVWCGTYTPPVSTFISSCEIKNKKIALFACHAGGGAEKCFENMKNELKDNDFIGEISFVNPLKHDKENLIEQITDWIKELKL